MELCYSFRLLIFLGDNKPNSTLKFSTAFTPELAIIWEVTSLQD